MLYPLSYEGGLCHFYFYLSQIMVLPGHNL